MFHREVERTGVDKNYEGMTEEKGFFKQVWHRLDKGFSFGFHLTVEEDVAIKVADVALGKDNSFFRMDVEESEPFQGSKSLDANAVVLTSDAYVDNDFLGKCDFAVCDTVSFRNMKNETKVAHNHYGKDKNGRIQLFRRGSVFIVTNDNEVKIKAITDALKNKKNFRKIGYNHYSTEMITINRGEQ
jgi:CRISPR-associated protein Cmr3